MIIKEKNNKLILLAIALLVGTLLGMGMGWYFSKGKEHKHDEAVADDQQEYTCSMHPQIRNPGPGKCPLCAMDLIPSSGAVGDPLVLVMDNRSLQLGGVKTTAVLKGDLHRSLRLNGRVAFDERKLQRVAAHFGGRVVQVVDVLPGSLVRRGQVVARIWSPQLVAARAEWQEIMRQSKGDTANALVRAWRARHVERLRLQEEDLLLLQGNAELTRGVPVRAEASGVLQERLARPGDYVSEGSALLTMADLSMVWAELEVFERDLSWVQVGAKVLMESLDGLPAVETSVVQMEAHLDAERRVVLVRAGLANGEGRWLPGQTLRGTLRGVLPQVVQVPRSAVLWTGARSVVWVADLARGPGAFRMREVRIGAQGDTAQQIISGLMPAEMVVHQGVFAVDASAQLQGKPSMLSLDAASLVVVTEADRAWLADYLQFKDALVLSDSIKAKQAMQNLYSSSPAQLETQREILRKLLPRALTLAQALSTTEKPYFLQHCPMAFNNQGADWIATETQIRNPYFGDAMLSCGLVKQPL